MIIVPAFSEGDETSELDVVPLYASTIDVPVTMALPVSEVPN
ncbi:hypothetical protein [Kordiimonas sp.]